MKMIQQEPKNGKKANCASLQRLGAIWGQPVAKPKDILRAKWWGSVPWCIKQQVHAVATYHGVNNEQRALLCFMREWPECRGVRIFRLWMILWARHPMD